ncbi:hypothetical protein [Sulfitobacter sp. PM12]|uniref:hypothetical protein n=1 Tax=Sulfitobacter sp. PM12 TaxID=3138497 RepID=UPI0038902772
MSDRDTKAKEYDAVVSGLRDEPCAFKRQCFRDGWDAAIGSLPDMVRPLEWLGGGNRHHAGNYVIEDISTPRREIRRLLHASFGTTYLADFGGDRPLEAAKAFAQKHYAAQSVSAFGVQGGEA